MRQGAQGMAAGASARRGARLRILQAGSCDLDLAVLSGAPEPTGRRAVIPVWMHLIETADARFLVDSGMPPGFVGRPDAFACEGEEPLIRPLMREEHQVERVLARLGLTPKDVDALVTTHLHFDHAGGQAAFADLPVVLHEAEEALGRSGAVPAEWFPEGPVYRPILGDHELAPGVRLLHTPGHSPGHLSVFVEVAEGPPVLLTIDGCYTRAHWEGAPGAWRDPEAGRASVERLRALARDAGARVFFGHDPDQARDPVWRPFLVGGSL